MVVDGGSKVKEVFFEVVGIFYRIIFVVFYFGSFFLIWCKLIRDGTGYLLFNCIFVNKVLSGV